MNYLITLRTEIMQLAHSLNIVGFFVRIINNIKDLTMKNKDSNGVRMNSVVIDDFHNVPCEKNNEWKEFTDTQYLDELLNPAKMSWKDIWNALMPSDSVYSNMDSSISSDAQSLSIWINGNLVDNINTDQ